jgi:hypothetical protein
LTLTFVVSLRLGLLGAGERTEQERHPFRLPRMCDFARGKKLVRDDLPFIRWKRFNRDGTPIAIPSTPCLRQTRIECLSMGAAPAAVLRAVSPRKSVIAISAILEPFSLPYFSPHAFKESGIRRSIIGITQNIVCFARLKHRKLHERRRIPSISLQVSEYIGKEQPVEVNSFRPAVFRGQNDIRVTLVQRRA